MATQTAAQLLKMEEEEFDSSIKDLSVKDLLDVISVLQKEMSKEQGHFDSLNAERSSLKKNSGQYKSVSKDMSTSQTRLTLLMNRSMKCFSLQGSQQSKAGAERRNSFQGSQSKANKTSEAVKATVVTQSAAVVNSESQSKRHSDIVPSNKTSIQVQSLKSNSPVLKNKNTNNVNGSGGVNGDSRKSLPFSLNKVSETQSLIGSDRSEGVKTDISVNEKNSNVNGQQKMVSVSNSGATLGPMADQKRFLSKSSDDIFRKPSGTAPQKTEVVKGKATKAASKVVMNADKQMIDLDSFTDRKNMLEELKKFDKPLKPSTGRTYTEKVTEVKLNLAKSGEKRSSANMEPKGSVIPVEQKVNILSDIKLGKKPSELRQTKAVNVKTEQSERNSVPKVSIKTSEDARVSQRVSPKMFDDLVKDIDSDKSEQSSEESPREAISLSQNKETVKNSLKPEETNTTSYLGQKNVNLPATGEVTIVEDKESTLSAENSEDSLSQSSGMSEEDDKFVTEFHFTGSQFKSPPATDTDPKKPKNTKNVEQVTPKVQQSTQAAPDQSSNHGNKGDVMVKGQGSSKVSGASGIHGNKGEDDEEELVVDTRVKFKEWDPSKLLAKLYEVKMMPDNIEDISHKFIGMEGLMEKLPMNKKKATLLKTWKRRFFRAKDGWLHYYESGNKDKPSDSLQLMGGKVEELGPRVLGVDDGRGKYLMVRVPTDHEYGLWKVALESQTADNVKATYVRPAPASVPHPKKKVIIIDIGSCGIRAGILGERATLPQVFFPSIVAVHKQTGEIIVGTDALKPEVRKVSTVMQPIQPTNKVDKFNIDMTVMKEIMKKVFTDLHVNQSQFLVMLSTPQNLGDKLREGLMRILIDEMHVQGVCMVQQSLLALYSYNAMSGIIVDIGERLEILPIYDGLLIEGGVSRQAYGGAKIQDSLYISLLENKYQFNSFVEKLLVRYICEQACYVTDNYKETRAKCDADSASFTRVVDCTQFDLPDGAYETVSIDYACFKSPEGFFNTDLWEMDYKNIQKQIYAAIQQCPMDSRKQMYRSIYLSGGVTTIPGFAERLQEEMRKLAPPAAVVEVHASPQRYHAAYIGACSVASMDVFEMSCVSVDEWKKMGVQACRKWGTG